MRTHVITLIALVANLSQAVADDARVAAIFTASRENLRRIETISFTMQPARGAEFVEYFHDRGRYRANIYLSTQRTADFAKAVGKTRPVIAGETVSAQPPVSERKPEMTVAYDGQRYYQQFGGDLFTHSAAPPMRSPIGQMTPLTEPFAWLFENQDIDEFGTLKGDAIWNKSLQSAKYIGEETIDGNLVDVVEVRRNAPERVGTVYFAKELGHAPIRWVSRLSDGTISAECRNIALQEVESAAGRAFVPVAMDYDSYQGGSETSRSFRVALDESSLRVNVAMPPDIFTLAPASAKEVQDLDTPPPDPGGPRPLREVAGSQRMQWLIAINVVVLTVIAAAVIWRRSQRMRL